MAELLLKVGKTNALNDHGDVVCAFNDRRILHVQAELICHHAKCPLTYDGLRDVNSEAFDYQEATYEFKFERVSRTEVLRTRLSDGSQVLLSDKPKLVDGRQQYIHVEDYLRARKKHPKHRIFGSDGAEIWFGGRTKVDRATIDAVWTKIQARTGKHYSTDESLRLHPLGRLDVRHFFPIRVQDFSDGERAMYEMVGTVAEGPPENERRATQVKRLCCVSIEQLPGLPSHVKHDVLDKRKPVDTRRDFAWVADDIVCIKGLRKRSALNGKSHIATTR